MLETSPGKCCITEISVAQWVFLSYIQKCKRATVGYVTRDVIRVENCGLNITHHTVAIHIRLNDLATISCCFFEIIRVFKL